MYSEHFKLAVSRLETEIEKTRELIRKWEDKGEIGLVKSALEQIKYHTETIAFIKRLDKELENGEY